MHFNNFTFYLITLTIMTIGKFCLLSRSWIPPIYVRSSTIRIQTGESSWLSYCIKSCRTCGPEKQQRKHNQRGSECWNNEQIQSLPISGKDYIWIRTGCNLILIETQTYVQINYRNVSYNIGQQIGSLYQDHCSNSETDRSNQTVIRRRSCQCSWSNSSTKWI